MEDPVRQRHTVVTSEALPCHGSRKCII